MLGITYPNSTSLEAAYRYDGYGNIISQRGELADINPIRYHGYYQDDETGFFYLQSRYYDPLICRFINADAYVSTGQGIIGCNMYAYCNNNPIGNKDTDGKILSLATILICAVSGLIIGGILGAVYAETECGLTPEDGWDYWKYVVYGGIGGGALAGLAGWAFAGTSVTASISWAYYQATTYIGTSAYAIGHAFEKWFYKAYNVIHQQVTYAGYRFDAILHNSIVELKNYNWSNYSNYTGLINKFVSQAKNYMTFIGQIINGETINGVTFCFSSKPPQEIINALRVLGVTVNWIS